MPNSVRGVGGWSVAENSRTDGSFEARFSSRRIFLDLTDHHIHNIGGVVAIIHIVNSSISIPVLFRLKLFFVFYIVQICYYSLNSPKKS